MWISDFCGPFARGRGRGARGPCGGSAGATLTDALGSPVSMVAQSVVAALGGRFCQVSDLAEPRQLGGAGPGSALRFSVWHLSTSLCTRPFLDALMRKIGTCPLCKGGGGAIGWNMDYNRELARHVALWTHPQRQRTQVPASGTHARRVHQGPDYTLLQLRADQPLRKTAQRQSRATLCAQCALAGSWCTAESREWLSTRHPRSTWPRCSICIG